jgi:hypothetical protein
MRPVFFRVGAVTIPTLLILLAVEAAVPFGADYRRIVPVAPHPVIPATSADEIEVDTDAAVSSSGNRSDPELLHVREANWHCAMTTAAGDLDSLMGIPAGAGVSRELDLQYDADGFRNRQPIETAQIAVIGDSFIEQANLPDAEILTSQLALATGETVVNLGQGYYGPQQELVVLKRYGLPRKPRSVVWVFFEGNDLEDALRYKTLLADWEQTVADHNSAWNRSFSRAVVAKVLGIGAASQAAQFPGNCRRGELSDGRSLWFLYPAIPLRPFEVKAIKTVRDCLREAASLCNQAEARFIIAFAPTKFRVYGQLCHFERDSECLGWENNDLPNRIGAIADDVGAAFVDLTAPFVEHTKTSDTLLYFANDTHWNAGGSELAAKAIASVIQEGGHR